MRTALVLLVALASCTPLAPPEVVRDASPDELIARVRAAAREERWGDLYEHLGAKLQGQCPKLIFEMKFPTQKLPPPSGYRVACVVARAQIDGVLPNPKNPDEAIVFYSYREQGGPQVHGEVLIEREKGSWRVVGFE